MMLGRNPIAAAADVAAEADDADWMAAVPALAPDYVATLNAFYRRRGALATTLAGRPVTVVTAWRGPRTVPIRDPCVLELMIDDERGAAVLPLRLLDTLVADPALTRLPPEHAAIVLELMLADGLAALEATLGCRLSIINLRRLPEPAPRTSFGLTLTVGDLGRVPCELALVPQDAVRLAAMLDRLAVPPSAALDFELPACLRVAAATLTLDGVRKLAPGDVVLVEQACRPDESAVLVIAEHLLAPAQIEPDGCRLTAPLAPGRQTTWEWSMEDHIDPSKATRLEDAGVEAIPVRVIFELGRVDMPLKQLATLAPGALVPLVRPLDEALDIVANGKRIGHGTLVRIGDSLGVRITRLFEHA